MKRALLPRIMIVGALLACGCPVAPAKTLPGLADMTRRVAAEGCVLLMNESGALPLTPERRVAVFGRMQVDYFACGYGSGGDVKTPYIENIIDALRRHPGIQVDESLAAMYAAWCGEHPPDNGSWGNWPLYHPETPLTDEVVAAAARRADTALVVIGRAAGEDREAKLEAGSYYLTALERSMLERVNARFDRVVVLLNSGNIIDMAWVGEYAHIVAVMQVWQGGMRGGGAIADVLSGDVSPSGKLTATIANHYADYPTSGISGGEKIFGGWEFSNYVEDIYVGYRYFETFAQDAVMYPFGFGLGYAEFAVEVERVEESDGTIMMDVVVANTSATHSGKEVVQVYHGAPQGQLGKAARSLVAYAKTNRLLPGGRERIRLSFSVDQMASYDDSGATGHKSCYVMEAGAYPLYVGTSVRDAIRVGEHAENKLRVTRRLSEIAALPPGSDFKRMKASVGEGGRLVPVFEDAPTRTSPLKDEIERGLPAPFKRTRTGAVSLLDVFGGKTTLENFVAGLSPDELEALCRGDYGMGSALGPAGNAAVYGGVLPSLREKGVSPVTAVDGPSGIRLGTSASLLPIGAALACSWNDELVEELYAMVGREMLLNNADVLLAPGMNIQRDPLGGRNFEYFSEDPLLSGQMGANVTRGLQSQGVSATPKHFGLNNQETRRNQMDARCSERALREIYSKGFEICVKTARPRNLMVSYNRVNGIYSHYHYDLCERMLRGEWGYEGVVMTDWWMQRGVSPDNDQIYDNAYRVRAGVDVLMPGEGPRGGRADRSLLDSLESGGGITRGEMQTSAAAVLSYVTRSPAFRKAHGLELDLDGPRRGVFSVVQKKARPPSLAALRLNGAAFAGFDPLIRAYRVFMPDAAQLPVVAAVPEASAEMEVEQATPEAPVATIKLSRGSARAIYRVYFTDEAGLEPIVENPIRAELARLSVNGREIAQFYPGIYEYQVDVADVPAARVTAEAASGVTHSITRDTGRGVVMVRAESPHQAMEYTIRLGQRPRSDEFNGQLGAGWTVQRETAGLEVGKGELRVTTERGDLYERHEDHPDLALKNCVAQPAAGSWEAVVKVELDALPARKYQGVGVMVIQDENHYLYFRCERRGEEGPAVIHLSREAGGTNSELAMNDELTRGFRADQHALYFKVRKNGDAYAFYASLDGKAYTRIGDSVVAGYARPKFALCASNGSSVGSRPITARYQYVRFTELPSAADEPIVIAGATKVRAEGFIHKTPKIDTQACEDEGGGLNVGWTGPGEFLLYQIRVEKAGDYLLAPRVASAAGPLAQLSYHVEVDGEVVASFVHGGTGGWQRWKSIEPRRVRLEKGVHKVCVKFNSADINLNYIEVLPVSSR